MDPIESVLDEACEDQRDALRAFHRSGSGADAVRIHYESCLRCERALDAIATMLADRPAIRPPVEIAGNRPRVIAGLIAVCALVIGMFGFVGYYAFVRPFLQQEPTTEALRMESRIEYARMPGRPDICVASLRGAGSFGPTFLGAAPCKDVRGRIVSDEGFAWRLREAEIVRIEDTDTCLAYLDDADAFTLPCGPDD